MKSVDLEKRDEDMHWPPDIYNSPETSFDLPLAEDRKKTKQRNNNKKQPLEKKNNKKSSSHRYKQSFQDISLK